MRIRTKIVGLATTLVFGALVISILSAIQLGQLGDDLVALAERRDAEAASLTGGNPTVGGPVPGLTEDSGDDDWLADLADDEPTS